MLSIVYVSGLNMLHMKNGKVHIIYLQSLQNNLTCIEYIMKMRNNLNSLKSIFSIIDRPFIVLFIFLYFIFVYQYWDNTHLFSNSSCCFDKSIIPDIIPSLEGSESSPIILDSCSIILGMH